MTAAIPLRAPPRLIPPGALAVPRAVVYPRGTPPAAWRAACAALARLPHEHEPRLTALLAAALTTHPFPVEHWVACILTSPDAADPASREPAVALLPRADARHLFPELPRIARVLAAPPPPDRLDVVLEAASVVGVSSCDLAPALPVTRAQAAALHLPARLLFAKGAAFASVAPAPPDADTLLAAWTEHRRLLDEHTADLAADALRAPAPADLAGLVLSLGPDARAVTLVPRADAARLCAAHPPLARRLAHGAPDLLPVVVWAAGHLSVHGRMAPPHS